jgi:CHASE2 domain-containing sensor protein
VAREHGDIPATVHFATGLAVVLAAAVLSSFLHNTSFGQHMEMVNLDAWFRFGSAGIDPRIAVTGITEADYAGPVFHRACPLAPDGIAKLIRAVALSGSKVIVVDLDTSEWSPEQRSGVKADLAQVSQTLGGRPMPQLAWAVGGSAGSDGKITLETFDAQGACVGVPASIPDSYGVVRGYLPYIPYKGAAVPSLANVAVSLDAGKGCAAESASPLEEGLPAVDLIEYTGGADRFVHVPATVLFGTAETSAWQNSNPLQGKIVVIGGLFEEARDRYVTPAGYLAGVDILASAIASAERGGIQEPSRRAFFLSDLVLGALLVTGSFFLHRIWVLVISFVAMPFVAFVTSLILYHYTGYFMSFLPILGAVFLHHLVEHGIEHWRLKKEVHRLRSAAVRDQPGHGALEAEPL